MVQSIFMPEHSPLSLLAFMGSGLALFLLSLVLLFALGTRRMVLAKRLVAAALTGGTAYLAALLFFSFTSREENLRKGDRKYFCEIDCHLAYSVERVERAKSLGKPPHEADAAGVFTVVTLKTWFDESTISSHRPREAPLYPNPRQVYVEDASGRRFQLSTAGQRALEGTGRRSTQLSRPLIPGESYVTELVFDLPPGARGPRLYVGDADPVASVLIGHEESPLHRKIWFRI